MHKGEIDICRFQLGRHQRRHRRLRTLGSGGGRANVQDLHFTKTVDKSSPTLFLACATGKAFRHGDAHGPKARRRNPLEYLDLRADRGLYDVRQHQRLTTAAASRQRILSR